MLKGRVKNKPMYIWIVLILVALILVGSWFYRPKTLSYPVQRGKEYKEAGIYKQDFLFYCALIEDTHPNQEFLNSSRWSTTKEYCSKAMDTVSNAADFAIAIQALSATLEDSHTTFLFSY